VDRLHLAKHVQAFTCKASENQKRKTSEIHLNLPKFKGTDPPKIGVRDKKPQTLFPNRASPRVPRGPVAGI